MLVTALACAGCDGLSQRPGADFAVRVLDASPITAVGQIYAPVRFEVTGCSAFDLELESDSGDRPLTFEEQPDGTYVASVPIVWMRERAGCWMGGDDPIDGYPSTLIATCHDAGRSARAEFSFRSGFNGGGSSASGDIRTIFPGDDPIRIGWIATSPYSGEVALYDADGHSRRLSDEWAPALDLAAYLNPLVRPRLARRGDRVFATLGCLASGDCPEVTVGPGESLPGERLADVALTDDRLAPPRAIAHVSASVVDMAFAADGALVVVSDTSLDRDPTYWPPRIIRGWPNLEARWGETIVWRVTPAPDGAEGVVEDEATVIARLPYETVATRLSRTASGALAFATVAEQPRASVVLNLHVVDGPAVTTSVTTAGSAGCSGTPYVYCPSRLWSSFVNAGVALSPDGSSLLAIGGDSYSDGPPRHELLYWMNTEPSDRVWQPFGCLTCERSATSLPRQQIYRPYANGGAAWPAGAVALWTGGDILYPDEQPDGLLDRVEVFEATPPRKLRYEYEVEALPGATRDPHLVGVTAVGDHLVLTTTTGVRILDARGELVGGADPLPCGATVTATAEQVGPTTVAVGVGDTVLSFEVGP
jgi:hypothetical protein